MKKLFLTAFLAVSLGVSAQTSTKEVSLSMTYYDVITLMKKNPALNFVGRYDKMTEVYDGDKLRKVLVSDDSVRMEFIPFKAGYDVFITANGGNTKYVITVMGSNLVGHGFVVDTQAVSTRILVNYLKDDKIIDDAVIKNL